MFLKKKGFDIDLIITFGQPRVTDEKIIEKIRPEAKTANFFFKLKNQDISIPNHFINLVADRLERYVKRPPIYWLYNLGILPEDAE